MFSFHKYCIATTAALVLSGCISSFPDGVPAYHNREVSPYYATMKKKNMVKDDLDFSDLDPVPLHASPKKSKPSQPSFYAKKNNSPFLSYETYYIVQEGDSLGNIAAKFHHSVGLIGEVNGLSAPYILKKGQKLRIPPHHNPYMLEEKMRPHSYNVPIAKTMPSSTKVIFVKKEEKLPSPVFKKNPPSTPTPAMMDNKHKEMPIDVVKAVPPSNMPSTFEENTPEKMTFIWPVKGKITAPFEVDADGLRNEGIVIQAPQGTPIKAAADGVVVYADQTIPGYGQVLILSHMEGYFTSYAHTQPPLVRKGDHVLQGDIIAKVGMTGNAKEPQLHFTIRKQKTSLDPMTLLPK